MRAGLFCCLAWATGVTGRPVRDRVQAHSLRTSRAGGKKVREKKKASKPLEVEAQCLEELLGVLGAQPRDALIKEP